jgi:hypothetical protein
MNTTINTLVEKTNRSGEWRVIVQDSSSFIPVYIGAYDDCISYVSKINNDIS